MDVFWRDRAPARRRTTSTRRFTSRAARSARGDRGAGRGAPARRGSRRRPVRLAAADARRAGTPAATARRSRLRRRAAAGEPLRRLGRRAARGARPSWPRSSRRRWAPSGRRAGRAGLPAEASSFVGRGHELGELHALLRRTRLLTLAGTGRRRQDASRARARSRRGGGLRRRRGARRARGVARPAARPDAVAAALDVRALPGRTLSTRSRLPRAADAPARARQLRARARRERAALADALLRAAPRLTILATSREPLRVPGEVVFRVPSLDIPDPEQALAPDELLALRGRALFVERAARRRPASRSTTRTRPTSPASASASTACRSRSSSPPAGWARSAPAAIAERLDDRFRLLRARQPRAPTRQQTLAATLQWSHDLLEPGERVLLPPARRLRRRLRARGGRAVCAGTASSRGDRRPARPPRREVARRRGRGRPRATLPAARDGPPVRPRAARRGGRDARSPSGTPSWALAFAEQEPDSTRLDREAANLRAALDGLLARARGTRCVSRGAVAVLAAGSTSPGAAALRRGARRGAGAHGAAGGGAARGGSDRLARRRWRAASRCARREPMRSPRDRRRARRVARAAVPGEFGDRERRGREPPRPWPSESSSSRVARASPPRRRSASTRSGSPPDLGDLAGAEELLDQSIELFRALAGSPSGSRRRATSRRCPRRPGAAGMRVVFEDTLQPFAEIACDAAGLRAREPAGIARGRGDLARRARCSTRARAVRGIGDERGRAQVLVRRAYIELAAGAPRRPRGLESGAELRRGRATGAVSASCSPGSR